MNDWWHDKFAIELVFAEEHLKLSGQDQFESGATWMKEQILGEASTGFMDCYGKARDGWMPGQGYNALCERVHFHAAAGYEKQLAEKDARIKELESELVEVYKRSLGGIITLPGDASIVMPLAKELAERKP